MRVGEKSVLAETNSNPRRCFECDLRIAILQWIHTIKEPSRIPTPSAESGARVSATALGARAGAGALCAGAGALGRAESSAREITSRGPPATAVPPLAGMGDGGGGGGGGRQADVRIGCSGFAYPHWRKGAFYPAGALCAAKDELRWYAGRLCTVEVNATFYAMPKTENFEK